MIVSLLMYDLNSSGPITRSKLYNIWNYQDIMMYAEQADNIYSDDGDVL